MAPKKDNTILEKKLESYRGELHREVEEIKRNLQLEMEQIHCKISAGLETRFHGVEATLQAVLSTVQQSEGGGPASSSKGKGIAFENLPEAKSSAGFHVEGKARTWDLPETYNAPPRDEWRPGRKLDFPVFGGKDLDGWVFWVEQYFSLNPMAEQEKMETVVVGLEGHALAWYQYMEDRQRFRNWAEMKAALVDRFKVDREGSVYQRLASVRQEGDVEDYITRFELLLSPLRGRVVDEMVEAIFVNGLQHHI